MTGLLDFSQFEWSREFRVFHDAKYGHPPSVIVRGDRMAFAATSTDTFGFRWNCSHKEYGHTLSGVAFDEALAWVQADDVTYDGIGPWFKRTNPKSFSKDYHNARFNTSSNSVEVSYMEGAHGGGPGLDSLLHVFVKCPDLDKFVGSFLSIDQAKDMGKLLIEWATEKEGTLNSD